MSRYVALLRRTYRMQLRKPYSKWMYLGLAVIFAANAVLFFGDLKATILGVIMSCLAVLYGVLGIAALRIQRREGA
jgi:hypothetical protein